MVRLLQKNNCSLSGGDVGAEVTVTRGANRRIPGTCIGQTPSVTVDCDFSLPGKTRVTVDLDRLIFLLYCTQQLETLRGTQLVSNSVTRKDLSTKTWGVIWY